MCPANFSWELINFIKSFCRPSAAVSSFWLKSNWNCWLTTNWAIQTAFSFGFAACQSVRVNSMFFDFIKFKSTFLHCKYFEGRQWFLDMEIYPEKYENHFKNKLAVVSTITAWTSGRQNHYFNPKIYIFESTNC